MNKGKRDMVFHLKVKICTLVICTYQGDCICKRQLYWQDRMSGSNTLGVNTQNNSTYDSEPTHHLKTTWIIALIGSLLLMHSRIN